MSDRRLSERLVQVRRRLLAVDGTAGLVRGLIAAIVCLIVGVWLDLMFELPPAIRAGFLGFAAAVWMALLVRVLYHAACQGAFSQLARRLDSVAGTGGQILSGFELSAAGAPGAYSGSPELTSGLARMAVERASHLADGITGDRAVPVDPIRRSSLVLAAIALLLAVAALGMPRLAATEWRRFADPYGDHPPYSSITFTVQPGNTRVVYGSGVDIRVVTAGGAVDGVELVLLSGSAAERRTGPSPADEEVLPMFPESGAEWRATIANVTSPARYFVRARRARSARYDIEVITVPQFEAVTFRVEPPAYTRLPATEGPLPESGLAGLTGTRVQIVARSNRPLSGGSLAYVLADDRRESALVPTDTASDTAAGSFTITGTGRIELQLLDVSGQRSAETWSTPVTRLVDERPFVRLVEPRAVSFATPTAIIPVVVAAEDDYGISRLQLFRSLNDSRSLPMELPVSSSSARQVYQVVHLPLVEYGLEPGDEIKLFARVEDNDPLGMGDDNASGVGGKGAESAVSVIRIISQEEFDKFRRNRDGMQALMAKYQEARLRAESLAEEIDRLEKQLQDSPGDERADDALRRELQELAQRMQQEAEALRKLQQDLQPFTLDKELTKELEQMEESLRRLSKQSADLAQNQEALHDEIRKNLAQMKQQLRQDRERLEQEAIKPLEMVAALARVKQDESRFVELYRRQRDLADRLASFKGLDQKDDPALKARMRDLEAEQRAIRAELDSLLNDIEEHVALLPDDESLDELRETALKFVKDVRESGAAEAMAEAETALQEFAGTRGHAEAEKAADILEKFLSQCKSMGEGTGQACRRFSPGLGNSMAQTLQELMMNSGSREGQGQGMGAGGAYGGYSARRSTMDNVGLYGNLPLMDSAAASRQGSSRQDAKGLMRAGPGGQPLSPEDASHQAEGAFRAAGSSSAAVPPRYRRQVGRYFQRLADELDKP
jgi:polyhydroxyalkanoate synthesis regulator protein